MVRNRSSSIPMRMFRFSADIVTKVFLIKSSRKILLMKTGPTGCVRIVELGIAWS